MRIHLDGKSTRDAKEVSQVLRVVGKGTLRESQP